MVTSYSLTDYVGMIADKVRTDAWVHALQQTVKPGSVVLDLGTGTGYFALLAARLGARRVYAIEPDDAIEVARELSARNGCSDRITFLQDLSTRMVLPEKVDVLISDLRGILPLFQHHIPSIIDARTRFLAPGATVIAQSDTLWAAVVEAPELHARRITGWEDNRFGLDLQPARRFLTNTWSKGRVAPEQLLVEPQAWAVLDYRKVDTPNASGSISWSVTRPGTGHGLCVWFSSILAPGVSLSNAPGDPELIYGSAFFPWPDPVTLAPGDRISAVLRADLVGEDYVWRWDACVRDHACPGSIKAQFKQSTFLGVPLSVTKLHRRAANHVPTLGEDGKIHQFILAQMDGKTALDEIARRVAAQFPKRFPELPEALTTVGDIAIKFGS